MYVKCFEFLCVGLNLSIMNFDDLISSIIINEFLFSGLMIHNLIKFWIYIEVWEIHHLVQYHKHVAIEMIVYNFSFLAINLLIEIRDQCLLSCWVYLNLILCCHEKDPVVYPLTFDFHLSFLHRNLVVQALKQVLWLILKDFFNRRCGLSDHTIGDILKIILNYENKMVISCQVNLLDSFQLSTHKWIGVFAL